MNFFTAFIHTYRRSSKSWLWLSLLVAAGVGIPLLIVLYYTFFPGEAAWSTLEDTFAPEAVSNTLWLCLGTGMLSLLIGVSTAWLVSQFEFPGRRFFEWALILPLTIPSYIMAFTYSGMFSYTGSIPTTLRNWLGESTAKSLFFDIMTFPWLVVLLSLVLYPYIYLTAKTAFSLQSANYTEAARTLGSKRWQVFFRVALPLARPAIAGGLFLVLMEVLNDYGAASYFGIRTFTTSIFRTWSYNLDGALLLAGMLMGAVLLAVITERLIRGRSAYSLSLKHRPVTRRKLNKRQAAIAFFTCLLPFAVGFLIPFAQLLSWTIDTAASVMNTRFWIMTWNSFVLAFWATAIILPVALLLSYNRYLNRGRLGQWITRSATIGYAVPGAVIAVGVLIASGWADQQISLWITGKKALWITGTLGLLVFAYLVRFLAVGYQPLDAALEKNVSALSDSSRTLGKNTWQTLWLIDMPVIRRTLFAAAILIFVDVLKELPLTLILRPFNFETLATEAYRHAKVMESVPESANAAIIIIFIGIVPLLWLHRLSKKRDAL